LGVRDFAGARLHACPAEQCLRIVERAFVLLDDPIDTRHVDAIVQTKSLIPDGQRCVLDTDCDLPGAEGRKLCVAGRCTGNACRIDLKGLDAPCSGGSAGPFRMASSYSTRSDATSCSMSWLRLATQASPASGAPVSCCTRSRKAAPLPGAQYTRARSAPMRGSSTRRPYCFMKCARVWCTAISAST
jgi:hypothetical protein